MIPIFKLDPLTVLTLQDDKDKRKKVMKAIEEYFKADRNLEEVCKELGIPKPYGVDA